MLKFARNRRRSDDTSDAILARLHRLHPKTIDLSLGRILRLLDRLDRPQDRLPPVIHAAGTNGKGSVIAFLRAILETAGYRVHAYTSPHLVRFNERIRLAGEIIPEPELAALLDECEHRNRDETITFFEITTAAALLAFARSKADVVLMECGLGGRYDATNVVARPALTIITPVSMDHMHYLGDTIRQIAAEKGAIQKTGVPSVIGPQSEAAAAVLLRQAEDVAARPFIHGRDWSVAPTARGFRYRSSDIDLDLPPPALAGSHQLANAGTAIACLERLEALDVSGTAIAEGLPAARWPGRLQRLNSGPHAASLPEGWDIWLDGGHNPAAGAVLADTAREWRDKPLHLVLGMMRHKEARHFLRPLAPFAASLRAIAIPDQDGSLSAEACAEAARDTGIRSATAQDIDHALADILRREKGPARILICGSLYLTGAVLARNEAAAQRKSA
jgi:dihydrofolate synthase/folylpolyglutamate synthase